MNDTFAAPRGWIEAFGEIVKFAGNVFSDIFRGRVLKYSGETLRQAGILIVSSTLVIWGLVFIIGLQCGIEGAYFNRSVGAPVYAGVFAAWCDLRELVPLVFGYMMAAKVGTGIVAELGSMRISDEIDALEVMGISGVTFLCATRLLGSMLVLGRVLWWVLPDLLGVPEPARPGLQLDQGDVYGRRDRAGRLLLRIQRKWRPRWGRHGDGQIDGL